MTPREALCSILWMVAMFVGYVSMFIHPAVREIVWKWLCFLALMYLPMLYFAWKIVGPSKEPK